MNRIIYFWVGALLCGCAATPYSNEESPPPSTEGGGYYLDDGPSAVTEEQLSAVVDVVPRAEKIIPATTRPYTALGRRYEPYQTVRPYRKKGEASWYGRRYHGRPTASGEIYDMLKMTAAHPLLPIPSYARVTRTATGKSIIVRINDRGPFLQERVIDLSFVAAHRLGIINDGTGEVLVEAIVADELSADEALVADEELSDDVPSVNDVLPANNVLSPGAALPLDDVLLLPTPLPSSGDNVLPAAVYIQLGAFSVFDNAKNLREKLIAEGFGGYANTIYRRGDLHLLLVGPYLNEAAAAEDDNTLCVAGWCGFLMRTP